MFLKVFIGDSMRKFQNLFAFGMLAIAAVLFAGCGSAETGGSSTDDGGSGSGTTATSDEGGDSGGGSDTSSTPVTTGDYQLVTLNVPKMT